MKKRGGYGFILLAATLAVPTRAEAVVEFTPVLCASCPSQATVSYSYAAVQYPSRWDLPQDPNCQNAGAITCPQYAHNIYHTRKMYANKWVKGLGIQLTYLDTEPSYDVLSFGTSTGPSMYSGRYPAYQGWHDVSFPTSLQSVPGILRFQSDVSVSGYGFDITGLRACCDGTAADGNPSIDAFRRNQGVLLGQNDVVYASFPNSATTHQTLAVWPALGSSGSLDADLYVRCYARPTPTVFSYRSWRSGLVPEYVHLPLDGCPDTFLPGGGTIPGVWFVAVHAYSGAGGFNLVLGQHSPSQHFSTISVGAGFSATPSQLQSFGQTAQRAVRLLYGASEGSVFFDSINVFGGGNCGTACPGGVCDICFTSNMSPQCQSIVSPIYNNAQICGIDWADERTVAHELSHKYFTASVARDEYSYAANDYGWGCGHTIMGDQRRVNTVNNYCYSGDHGRDPRTGWPADSDPVSMWTRMYSSGHSVYQPTETPDNYSYIDFDFAGQMGTLVLP